MTGSEQAAFGWGIVGTGAIAELFAADIGLLPEARVAAVHSRSSERAGAFAGRFGARVHAELDALLADPAVEAVYVATPNNLHVALGLRAIAAGKPVLIEKPLALSSRDALGLAQAAQERGVFAMEAMWTRFLPAVEALRRQLAAGAVGPVRRIRAELSYFHPQAPHSRFFDPALGGGAAFDLGVYPLSLALYLLGAPERVTGRWLAAGTGVDLRSEITLHYGAATAELACGFDSDGENRFVVEGAKGTLSLGTPFLRAQRLTHDAWLRPGLLPERGLPGRIAHRLPVPGRKVGQFRFPGNGLQFQARAAMAAIRAGAAGSDVMSLGDSAAVLAIIETVLAQPPVPRL